jgi:hypothetical protein
MSASKMASTAAKPARAALLEGIVLDAVEFVSA